MCQRHQRDQGERRRHDDAGDHRANLAQPEQHQGSQRHAIRRLEGRERQAETGEERPRARPAQRDVRADRDLHRHLTEQQVHVPRTRQQEQRREPEDAGRGHRQAGASDRQRREDGGEADHDGEIEITRLRVRQQAERQVREEREGEIWRERLPHGVRPGLRGLVVRVVAVEERDHGIVDRVAEVLQNPARRLDASGDVDPRLRTEPEHDEDHGQGDTRRRRPCPRVHPLPRAPARALVACSRQ